VNRLRFVTTVSLPLLALLTALPAAAQQRPGRPVAPGDNLRLQIAAMEGVLATAVHEIHAQQLEKVMPGFVQFEGSIRARGFRLDGYGVFFDVDLPPLPRTVEWTFRVLGAPIRLDFELSQLRRQVAEVGDPRLRQQFEQTLRTIQRKVETSNVALEQGTRAGRDDEGQEGVQARNAARQGAAQPAPVEPPPAQGDPFAAYQTELGQALADLMVQYGGTISLAPDDWLTIAVRESQPRLLPGGPAQMALTLRIKGSDLAAFKAGRLTPEEARKKVEIKES